MGLARHTLSTSRTLRGVPTRAQDSVRPMVSQLLHRGGHVSDATVRNDIAMRQVQAVESLGADCHMPSLKPKVSIDHSKASITTRRAITQQTKWRSERVSTSSMSHSI